MRAVRSHKGSAIKLNGLLILLAEYEFFPASLYPRFMYNQMSFRVLRRPFAAIRSIYAVKKFTIYVCALRDVNTFVATSANSLISLSTGVC